MKKRLFPWILMLLFASNIYAQVTAVRFDPVAVSTVAGSIEGYLDGISLSAKFARPNGIATDAAGNIYVADKGNHSIRKITPGGIVSTFAGNGTAGFTDGTSVNARFDNPSDLAIDATGNIYVADGNHSIRKISPGAVVTTLAGTGIAGYNDGPGNTAQFNSPQAVTLDALGNVYVADYTNNRIRKINPTGTVSTFAGSGIMASVDGTGSNAQFMSPWRLAIDGTGNIYVVQMYGPIRKITPDAVVSTPAYSGTYNGFIYGIAIDADENIYLSITYGFGFPHYVIKINPGGHSTLVAGGDMGYLNGTGGDAKFAFPGGMALDQAGNLYVIDQYNNRIRKISIPSLSFSSYEGMPSADQMFKISAVNLSANAVLTAPPGYELSLTPGSGYANTLSFTPLAGVVSASDIYIRLKGTNVTGNYDGNITLHSAGAATKFLQLHGKVLAAVLKFDPIVVSTHAGSGEPGFADGTSMTAKFSWPGAVATDASGNVYIADCNNHRIRKIAVDGTVSTFAGNGTPAFINGAGTAASFNFPSSVTIDAGGNIYVADQGNNSIRKITSAGMVSTLAGNGIAGFIDGTGSVAKFNEPTGVIADNSGNIYVADGRNHSIRKVSPLGVVNTFAGNGSPGSEDGTGASAQFNLPVNVALDGSGNLYVTQIYGPLRKITPLGAVTTIRPPGMFPIQHLGVVVDSCGSAYVSVLASGGNNYLYKVSAAGIGAIELGNMRGYQDGIGMEAKFEYPRGICMDASGNIYIADAGNNRIRKASIPVLIFEGIEGVPTPSQFFKISGANLSYNANIAAPPGYEISLSPGFGYTTSLSLAPVAGELNSITVYIRLHANAPGLYNGNIAYTCTGAETRYLPVTGRIGGPGLKFDPILVTTVAGSGEPGFADGTATMAKFYFPFDAAVDASGNVYVADDHNNRIRKIATNGMVTTIAGNGNMGFTDGMGTAATFNFPAGIALDPSGNLYVSDGGNHSIRKINPAGLVSTLAGNGTAGYNDATGMAAQFSTPSGITMDGSGNLYVADQSNQRIRKINPGAAVSTLSGNGGIGNTDGPGSSAQFNYPRFLNIGPSNNLLLTETFGPLRKVSAGGYVSTISNPALPNIYQYAAIYDRLGNIYVSITDFTYNQIYKLTPAGNVSIVAGGLTGYQDGIGTDAKFNGAVSLFMDSIGNIYIADASNNRIRKLSIPNLVLSGTAGSPSSSKFFNISGVSLSSSISITAPLGFELSLTPNGSYATTLSLSPISGEVSSVIYIRLKGDIAGGIYNGNITLASPGAVTQSLAVSGTVTDIVPPVVNCPASLVFCHNSSNYYTFPPITATDISGIQSIRFTISGATNRNGTGPNASGTFAPGISLIKFIVTDNAGNRDTCQTTIKVNQPLSVSISTYIPYTFGLQSNTIYLGYGPSCATLTANPGGGTSFGGAGYTYLWSTGQTSRTISVCPTSSGIKYFTVVVTDALGCNTTFTTAIRVIDVRCGPNGNKVIVCWLGFLEVCSNRSQVALALLLGAQIGHCGASMAPVTKNSESINEQMALEPVRGMTVFPNPNHGSFTLQLNNIDALHIRIIDQKGKLVYQQRLSGNGKSKNIPIHTGNLASGMYMVQASGKDGQHSCKLIIQ